MKKRNRHLHEALRTKHPGPHEDKTGKRAKRIRQKKEANRIIGEQIESTEKL